MRKKILIIGPIYPYRGGIAHYTSLMAKSLSRDNEVRVFSFKMQYPKMLYSGEQKEYGSTIFRYDDVVYNINTLNPLNWIRIREEINKYKPDLIIVQWWHIYFAPVYQGILRRINQKTPVIFICHNIFPHEGASFFARFLTKTTLVHASGMIVHSDSEADSLKEVLDDVKFRIAMIPTFNVFKRNNVSVADARKLLGISENTHVLLFFGFIRKYKGLKYLIDAMPQITKNHADTELIIVGEFFDNDRDDYCELIEKTGCSRKIRLVEGYLPDEEVEPYFAACDVLVLPYISATQSGIVQIAYSFEKPVIATRVGGLPDVVVDGKTGYIIEPEDTNAIVEAVKKYYDIADKDKFTCEIHNHNRLFSWEHMNDVIEDLYEEIKGGSK